MLPRGFPRCDDETTLSTVIERGGSRQVAAAATAADTARQGVFDMTTTGLVRVTIAAPQRRMDLAMPERAPMAELLPTVLRHAGESLADDGVGDGGWVLRRPDGTEIDGSRALGAHRVRDGEVLHLVPRTQEWPELEYDDLVDAIASGAGRTGRMWSPRTTRRAGLAACGVAVALALMAVLRAGPPWSAPGLVSLVMAVVLVACGAAMASAFGDSAAGAVIAAYGLVPAFLGAAMSLAGELPPTQFGAPQFLAGFAALLLTAVLGYVGVTDGAAVFAGAASLGLFGAVLSWAALPGVLGPAGAAGVVAGLMLIFSPLFGPLAIRIGRLPMPVLPRNAADLVRDDPQPPRHAVYAAVLRADGLLTGLIVGASIVAMVCQVLLALQGSTSAVILLLILASGFCLRARLYPAIRQRVPILCAGITGAGCLVAGPLMSSDANLLAVVVPILIVAAAGVLALGLVYSRRPPSAYFGRYAELLEVVVVLATVPVVVSLLGLFGFVRGLAG